MSNVFTEEWYREKQGKVRGGVEGHAHRGTMIPKMQGRSVSSGGEHHAPAMEKGRGPSEPVSSLAPSPPLPYRLRLFGQLVSGKNRVMVRSDGRHYPTPGFVNWRSTMFQQILDRGGWGQRTIITVPVALTCDYWPGDHRTRDVSGMLDALFHLLVYAKILQDDGLIYSVSWRRHNVTKIPSVTLALEAWYA